MNLTPPCGVKGTMKTKPLHKYIVVCTLFFVLLIGLAGCKAEDSPPPAATDSPTSPQSGQLSQDKTQDVPTAPEALPVAKESDPETIDADWQSSSHADTFVMDDQGQNNTCARCHAPVEWSPSMEELPESCFVCKFELKDPPPLIPETDWTNISCKVCHEVDKKDNIQPGFAWLEIAPLGEYSAVASATELCLKCHAPVDIPNHGSVTLSGAHQGYECTQCHSAHSTAASCTTAGCHGDSSIAAHDDFHQDVSCAACHDGSGLEINLDETTGLWIPYLPGTPGTSVDKFAFTSHDTSLEVDCGRCHFVNNPWDLSDSVMEP